MAPTLNFSNVEQLYGDKWYFYHRVDMHKHLREMAEAAGAVIRLGQRVDDVELETGIIHLQDGATVQKDLVIVADGQHVSSCLAIPFSGTRTDRPVRIASTPKLQVSKYQ